MNGKGFNKQCPACGGLGETMEPLLDDGSGPTEACGYCSNGRITNKHTFYVCLAHLSAEKRQRKAWWKKLKGATK